MKYVLMPILLAACPALVLGQGLSDLVKKAREASTPATTSAPARPADDRVDTSRFHSAAERRAAGDVTARFVNATKSDVCRLMMKWKDSNNLADFDNNAVIKPGQSLSASLGTNDQLWSFSVTNCSRTQRLVRVEGVAVAKNTEFVIGGTDKGVSSDGYVRVPVPVQPKACSSQEMSAMVSQCDRISDRSQREACLVKHPERRVSMGSTQGCDEVFE